MKNSACKLEQKNGDNLQFVGKKHILQNNKVKAIKYACTSVQEEAESKSTGVIINK